MRTKSALKKWVFSRLTNVPIDTFSSAQFHRQSIPHALNARRTVLLRGTVPLTEEHNCRRPASVGTGTRWSGKLVQHYAGICTPRVLT